MGGASDRVTSGRGADNGGARPAWAPCLEGAGAVTPSDPYGDESPAATRRAHRGVPQRGCPDDPCEPHWSHAASEGPYDGVWAGAPASVATGRRRGRPVRRRRSTHPPHHECAGIGNARGCRGFRSPSAGPSRQGRRLRLRHRAARNRRGSGAHRTVDPASPRRPCDDRLLDGLLSPWQRSAHGSPWGAEGLGYGT